MKKYFIILGIVIVGLLLFLGIFINLQDDDLLVSEAFCSSFVKLDNSYCDDYDDLEIVSSCKESSLLISGLYLSDVSYCSEIASIEMKNICFAFVKDDPSYCNVLSEDNQLCLDILSGDKPIEEGSILGENFYNWFNAVGNKEADYCYELESRDTCKCLALLGQVNLCNAEMCDELIYDNAINEVYCSEILNEDLKAKCIAKL